MLTRWVSQSPYSYRSVGKARSAGLSSDSKRLRRDPSRLRKGRSLSRTNNSWYGLVDLRQAEEFPLPQGGQDPPLDQQHACLHLRLVTRFHAARRHYRYTAVRSHLLICPIDTRLIAASFRDAGLQVIGDDDLGHAAQKLEGAQVGADPVGQPLRPSRLRVGVAAGPQHGDEDLCRRHLACRGVMYGNRVAGVIYKQLLAGPVLMPQNEFLCPKPSSIQITEPAVAVAVRVLLAVLLPQEL